MKKSIERNTKASLLRKDFDSFTKTHRLLDAQEEFAQAVYRYRIAEVAGAENLITLKREMEFLDRKVLYYRYCIYSCLPIEDNYIEELAPHVFNSCPIPAWGEAFASQSTRQEKGR